MRLFTTLGIPAPATMVLLVGVLELGAVVLLLLDRYRWIAVLLLAPVMAVAAWRAREWQAIAVLLALAGLLAIDRGVIAVSPTAPSGGQSASDRG